MKTRHVTLSPISTLPGLEQLCCPSDISILSQCGVARRTWSVARKFFLLLFTLLLSVFFLSSRAYAYDYGETTTQYTIVSPKESSSLSNTLVCPYGKTYTSETIGNVINECFVDGYHQALGYITWTQPYYPANGNLYGISRRYNCTARIPPGDCGVRGYEFTRTTICKKTGKPPINGKCEEKCPLGKAVTASVNELNDACYEGCEVEQLWPTDTNKWVPTLQGVNSGKTCTDKAPPLGKMLACAKSGSSGYSTKTKHPIDFAIGNKFFRATDYRGTGSFPIVFGRTYNSLDLGWRFTYTQRIEQQSPTQVVVRRPGGQSYDFNLSGSTWSSDPDVVERLEWQSASSTWVYILADNTKETYDANGRLLSIRNSQGQVQTLSYSADGSALTITAPDGDQLSVELNANGLLPTHITDKSGRVTEYLFNGLILNQINNPDGTNKQYLYEVPERPWLITGIIDENGHRSNTVAYDDQGRAIMSELADGAERVEVSYNADGTTTLTNALGKKTTFTFEIIHGVKKIVHVEGEPTQTCQGTAMDYSFDANGFLTEKVDAKGIVTQFSHDANGLELSRTEAAGLPESRTINTQWDSALRKPLVVTEGNTETRYVYDAEGRTLERSLVDLTTGNRRTTGYNYNAQGLLATVDGPRVDVSDITTYSYDVDGRLSTVTNALGHTTEIVTRDAYGRPILTRDANGLESRLAYDDKGRLIERLVGTEKTSMSYDPVGNLTAVTAPGGITLSYEYDAANRLIAIVDSDGNRIDYTLDPMGNRTEEKVTDTSGQLTRRQQKVYDELSRLLMSVGASGQITTYGYDRNDNRTQVIDPLQQLHRSAYDGLNRLVEQTNPINGVTSYGYDTHDRLTAVTDPNNNTTTYVYDGLGNLMEQHSPDTGTTTFSHDAAGNVLTKSDANGLTTTYTYDALNRLIQTTYADGTVITYTYDTAPNGIGRLAQISEPGLTTAWAYDLHGRTVSRSRTLQSKKQAVTQTTAWQYDTNGHLSGITYPSGMQVGYTYVNGQIEAMTVNGQPLLNAITYQAFGPVSGWTWANGSQSVRGYDLDGRLISQSLGNGQRLLTYDANGNITAISSNTNWSYGYDALSRLTAANDDVQGCTNVAGAGCAGATNLAWEYDANGNRLSQDNSGTVTAYTIGATSNRLVAVNTADYAYDPNGNLIDDGTHTYQYDTQNRLVTIDNGDTAEYRYNALGQRISKIAIDDSCGDNGKHNGWDKEKENKQRKGNDKDHRDSQHEWHQNITCVEHHRKDKHDDKGRDKKGEKGKKIDRLREHNRHQGYSERLFIYDDHRLLGEYNRKGKVDQETIWLGNLPVATVKHDRVYAIHSDHLGTPRVITDKNNTEIWRWDSDPFGTTAANDDPDGDGRTFSYNLRFPGQYFDSETGKHYNYFRDYDPSLGRYIESDPVGLKGGLNTFAYVDSNPLFHSDALGLRRGSVSGFLQKIIEEYLLARAQSQVENELVQKWERRIQDIWRQLGLVDDALAANDDRRLLCDANCIEQSKAVPCFDYKECMDKCWDEYIADYNILIERQNGLYDRLNPTVFLGGY